MQSSRLMVSAILLGGAAITSACATHTHVHPTRASRSYAPVCVDGVATYDDFSSVPYDYYEVAFITGDQNSVYNDKSQLITEMRKRAGEQGGNALVVNSVSASKSTVKRLGEALGANSAERNGKGVAIFMPADSTRVKNACGHS